MSLETMTQRLEYRGGNQEQRMISDKLRSLKKALLYSYQAATAILEDGREFRCLINPDKNKIRYDDKIISIPFEDICIGHKVVNADGVIEHVVNNVDGRTSSALEEIPLKVGDIFEWKETETYWIVYLQYLEEDAYFRGEIRKADEEIDIDGKKYRGYLRGPEEEDIEWHTKRNISWTDPNYSVYLYIAATDDTLRFFHRFQKLKIRNKNYEVQVVDSISNEGLLMISLREDYNNEMEEASVKNQIPKDKSEVTTQPKDEVLEFEGEENEQPYIDGSEYVYPYDKKTYKIKNFSGKGIWSIDNEKKATITYQSSKAATIEFTTGRSGIINLTYKSELGNEIVYKITIQSL